MKSQLNVRVRGAAAALTAGVLVTAGVGLASPALAAPAPSGTLDQSLGAQPTWVVMSSSSPLSQVFTAGLTGGLVEVRLPMSFNSVPTSLTLEIKAVDGSSNPTGAALASSTVGNSYFGVSQNVAIPFVLSNPTTSLAGTQYALVLNCTGCVGGVQAGWNLYSISPFTKAYSTYVDTTYVPPVSSSSSGAPPPPPDISHSVGMPASGNCNAIDDKSLNWGGATSGSWTPSWAAWTNGGKGGAVCNRFLRYNANTTTWFSVSQ